MDRACRNQTRWALAAAVIWATPILADSFFVNTLERKDTKITNYRNGQIEFSIDGRAKDPVPGDRVTRITLDDDAVFSKAEAAFADSRWAEAADGYKQALKNPSRPWLKDWILPRMGQAANSSGKFDVAVTAFILTAQRDPQEALKLRPNIPGNVAPALLAATASEIATAAGDGKLTAAQKQALLSLLLDVRRVQGDFVAAGQVGEQLLKITPADPSDPANAKMLADIHVGMSRLSLARKEYDKAIAEIQANAKLFTEPAQQVEAFYCLAAAQDGKLASPSPDQLKDLANDYMRVVAAARPTVEKRYIPECLFRVAEIQEKLGEAKLAASLYAEVATEYKDNTLAEKARERSERLGTKTGK